MPNLDSCEKFRLFGVSENLDENGKYQLVPFDNKAFNKAVIEDKIDDMIFKIAEALYGYGNGTGLTPIYSGSILTKKTFGLEVENIVDKIDANPRHSQCYLVNNAQNTDLRWFVAVSQDYSG